MNDYEKYAMTVHVSLLQKKQLFGIGETTFYLIVMLTLILVSLLSAWFFIVGLLLYIVAKFVCKNEPLFMDFLFTTLSQSNHYWGGK